MSLILKRNVHWMLSFVIRIFKFIVVIDLIVLPILLILGVSPLFIIWVTFGQGFFVSVIGGLLVLNSLFSTIERHEWEHIGYGSWKVRRIFKTLTPQERLRCLQKGIIMIIIGLLLIFASQLLLYKALIPMSL